MKIKPIILPENDIIGVKFVQVYLLNNGGKEPILRYNSKKEGYHSHMLQDIVRAELGLKLETITLDGGGNATKPRTDKYELCGAGLMNFMGGTFIFSGCSGSGTK